MSSTYSPNLRIELIGTGDQAGNWGDTTNTNLGTLIEDSISGYEVVSVTSASQALTATNGAADQARNAILAVSTTTGANFAIYAPPAPKTYIFYNTSAYVATIYNSTVLGNTTAAGNGVAVPAGKKLAVFSDGTDFSTIEAVGLSATLAVASGGTGATSAANARTNLGAQETLVSGTNIKTLNSESLLGSGNITITSPEAFPSGTVMLFVQTAAPTGWTKSTAHNNKALRLVSGTVGTGGSAEFTTAFGTPTVSGSVSLSGTVGATTLTTTQMPSHSHGYTISRVDSTNLVGLTVGGSQGTASQGVSTGSTGGNGSHDHSFSGSGSLSGATAAINVQYVDAIIAAKD